LLSFKKNFILFNAQTQPYLFELYDELYTSIRNKSTTRRIMEFGLSAFLCATNYWLNYVKHRLLCRLFSPNSTKLSRLEDHRANHRVATRPSRARTSDLLKATKMSRRRLLSASRKTCNRGQCSSIRRDVIYTRVPCSTIYRGRTERIHTRIKCRRRRSN